MSQRDGYENEDLHSDELYRYEYAHGTRYLGKMGAMAFAHFDLDDDGTIYPLAMQEQEFKQNREKWTRIGVEDVPSKVLERIERKFGARKCIHERLPGGET